MKLLLVLLFMAGTAYFAYQAQEEKHEIASLKSKISALEKQTDDLQNQVTQESSQVQANASSKQSRLADLKSKLDVENGKLQSLQDRKRHLQDAIHDPSTANSNRDTDSLIHDKKAQIASIEEQIRANQASEHDLDRNGSQAKAFQKVNQQNSLADLNQRIAAQQDLIKNTQASIQAEKKSNDYDKANNLQNLNNTLSQQKADLEDLKHQRNAINQNASITTLSIQQQVEQEKARIKTTEQELHSQSDHLKNEIKDLEASRGHSQSNINNLKTQSADLDVQIKAEQEVIDGIQALIKKD